MIFLKNACLQKILVKVRILDSVRFFARHPTITTMELKNRAIVKHLPEDQNFSFSFVFNHPQLGIQRQFNLTRPIEEASSQFKGRLLGNIEKALAKKRKRKANQSKEGENDQFPAIQAIFSNQTCNELQFGEDVPIREILFSDHSITMNLMGNEYIVDVNPPMVESVKLQEQSMAGFFVYPYKLKMSFADFSLTKFSWFVSAEKFPEGLDPKAKGLPQVTWVHRQDSYFYEVTDEDIGGLIRLVIHPKDAESREGLIYATTSKTVVSAGPGLCGFEARQAFTKTKTLADELRVVTYNLLADLYADSEYSRTVLHPQCPPYALAIEYRKQLLLKELLGFNADILCLQEVDAKVFDLDLCLVLEQPLYGYQGTYASKAGSVNEGEACFWRTDKFDLIEAERVILGESLRNKDYVKDILGAICENDQLMSNVAERSTVVQLVVLKHKSSERLVIVANTHMYFKPEADHVRLLQSAVILRELAEKKRKLVLKHPKCNISVLICGDFNSTPPCGVFEFYTKGSISSDHPEWQVVEGQEVTDLNLQHQFKLDSACGTPEYTNFTLTFKDCLDYIFFDKENMEVREVVPFPSKEELDEIQGIPNIGYPSDHLPCIATLTWKDNRSD